MIAKAETGGCTTTMVNNQNDQIFTLRLETKDYLIGGLLSVAGQDYLRRAK